MPDKQRIILSAGGTGGHMTPALALAKELTSRGCDIEVLTDQRGLKFEAMFDDVTMHPLRAGTLGAGLAGKIMGLLNLVLGIAQAFRFLMQHKPSAVVGFGGYPSFPGVFAAQFLGIPTVLHEQNAIIGKANLYLVPKAKAIALSYANYDGIEKEEQERCLVLGNPVRPEVKLLHHQSYPDFHGDAELRILVIGGSLGATVFSDIVPATLASLSENYRKRLHVTQQCREEDIKRVQTAYSEAGITAYLATFFDDMPKLLQESHLVIARSGASTVAEVTVAGRPAIFVPYPHHKDQQQKLNADVVCDEGGAWMMNEQGFTVDALQTRIEGFLQNPETLMKAAEKSKSCGRPDAAKSLADVVEGVINNSSSFPRH